MTSRRSYESREVTCGVVTIPRSTTFAPSTLHMSAPSENFELPPHRKSGSPPAPAGQASANSRAYLFRG
eukprot:763781-Hanusia_phi.AAC.1